MVVVKFWCLSAISRFIFTFLLVAAGVGSLQAAEESQARGEMAKPSEEQTVQTAEISADADALETLLADQDGLLASFRQRDFDAYGRPLDESTGALTLARPNVRWEVEAPFPQTILLSQGELQIYDPDLEQLTIKSLGENWGGVPLALLTKEGLDLAQKYRVSESLPALRNGETYSEERMFVLYPIARLDEQSYFAELRITFFESRLQALELKDHSNQRTRITFHNHTKPQVVQSSLFELKIPEGTEVVRG